MTHDQTKYVAPKQQEQGESPLQPADVQGGLLSVPRTSVPKVRFSNPNPPDPKRDPKSIVLRELTTDDFMLAQRLAAKSSLLSFELLKLSLYRVDNRLVNHAEDEATGYLHKWSAKFRQQALLCYDKMHNTKDEEDAILLESMEPVAD